MNGVDIVFHCAALKHVILSERSPEQCANVLMAFRMLLLLQLWTMLRLLFLQAQIKL